MPDVAVGRALALVFALSALAAGAQTMYKWKDEKGVTHFSESPPPDDKKAEKVTPKVTPPSGSGNYDANAWKSRDSEARKRQIERGKGEQAEAKDKEQRSATCNRARSRLSMLQNTQVIYRDNPDGTRSFMGDSERDGEMARARQAIKDNCD